jgi:hypothetical protein
MIWEKRLLKIGFVLILQLAMVLGGLLGSDVALAYNAQERYNERYDLCMKTDDRGAGYCRQWAGPSGSSSFQRPYMSSSSSKEPYISSIDERIDKFKNCVIEESQEVEYCEKFLDP